ncbi:MAG: hypothetical protein H0U76_15565 [Ktedonobacteraceae bacterium]|nr:hypothetical protein [Ktedonobacteraceae bacterium]
MARSKPARSEVQTTLRIDSNLHYWLRQYALQHRTTFIGIVENVLLTWAEEQGFKSTDSVEAPQTEENPKTAP